MNYIQAQTSIITSLNRHFLVVVGIVIVALITAQFFVMATIGTNGAAIEEIRAEKASLRLKTEYLQAEIDKVRTSQYINQGVADLQGLSQTSVQAIPMVDGDTLQQIIGSAL